MTRPPSSRPDRVFTVHDTVAATVMLDARAAVEWVEATLVVSHDEADSTCQLTVTGDVSVSADFGEG